MSKEKTEIAPAAPTALAVGRWNQFNTIEKAWQYAQYLAASQFIPTAFKDKPHDCLIAIEMAERMNIAPLMFLQNSYIVHGRPGMEAKMIVTLINQSGLFTDPLDYEVRGKEPKDKDYAVRCYAARARTGKVLYGPWIDWEQVNNSGWASKSGSAWKTTPGIMFNYRAASWFCNQHCPEVKMGMETKEELQDIAPESGRKKIESKEVKPIGKRMGFEEKAEAHSKIVNDLITAEKTVYNKAKEVTLKEVATSPPPFDLTWTCTECGHAFDEVTLKDKIPVCPACSLSTGLKKNEKQPV